MESPVQPRPFQRSNCYHQFLGSFTTKFFIHHVCIQQRRLFGKAGIGKRKNSQNARSPHSTLLMFFS